MAEDFLEQSFVQLTPRWPFAAMRMFLGILWIYESFRMAPWDIPALVIGIFLLAGILTPVTALAGLVLTTYVYNMRHSPLAWGEWVWIYWIVILLHAVMIVSRAGRRWGADAIAAKSHPDWVVW